jgi:hypothetical protein
MQISTRSSTGWSTFGKTSACAKRHDVFANLFAVVALAIFD